MSQTQQLKIFRHYIKSEKGHVREENQDACTNFDCINGSVFALCDGMGGIADGKKAAKEALKKIEKYFSADWYDDEIVLIKEAIEFANEEIRKNLGHPKTNVYPGTTIVLVLIRDNKVFYAHVGDSRIYYQTGKKMFRLTEDHSLVMKMLKEKKITKEEAENHNQKNVIYNALGIKEKVLIEINEKPILPADNDFILLCSDGLTNELKDEKILSVLKKDKTIKEKGKLLINSALNKGGEDNITVQLIQFYNTGNKKKKNYRFEKEKKKRRLIRIAVFGFLFLLVNAIFMFNYFYTKRETKNRHKNQEKKIISYDLTYPLSTEKQKTYSAGRNIYTYPFINQNTIIEVLRVNNKKEFYFFPGEKIKTFKKKAR